ncbi:LacI family DNA-binding transcriptional regulator [Maribacter sp. 2-571]|uniref:LacI family DNA-binding transcriptional regulator n=1 Tax=Maribacter sp. 2-571 TaxID=3417569 RepID=UPI003D3440A3
MKNGKPTIHEIARELNLDSSTVSRALNNSDRVTKKTIDRVTRKAEEMGYRRNLMASNLRKKKSNTIGVIVPRISRYFFSSTIAGIDEAAFAAGYNVIICQSLEELEREQGIISNLMANQVDGVLISVSMETKNGRHLKQLRDSGIPLIFFDRHLKELEGSGKVLINDEDAAAKATGHLIEIGCKKIAHFTGPSTLQIYKSRLKGYRSGLRKYQLPYDPDLVVSSRLSEKDGIMSVKKILEKNSEIDGIFSANDVAAIGAMKYLKSIGKKIPDDIALVGFSNEPISEVIEPALTTIDQSPYEIGKIACSLLIEQIGNKTSDANSRTIILESTLLERDSTKR